MSRPNSNNIIDQLVERPYAFEFFQAMRLLGFNTSTDPGADAKRPVGYRGRPDREVVRFATAPTFRFSPNDISEFSTPYDETKSRRLQPASMTVLFMGLTGPQGVLPQHYTQEVIDRERRNELGLREFFDLFNHRLISLYYRAWEKYRFPVLYERRSLSHYGTDDFTQAVFSFAGMGTGGLRQRLEIDDRLLLYYSGQFARSQPNANSLQRMVAGHFCVKAEIEQFVGQWMMLDVVDQTQVGMANSRLGESTVVGDRVWGIESRFTVRIGPLGYRDYMKYSPLGTLFQKMSQFIRTYVGPEFDFDIQPVLTAEDVPELELSESHAPRLGWNTWVRSDPFTRDADDAVFACDGSPQLAI